MKKAILVALALVMLSVPPASALGDTLYDQSDNESIIAENIASPNEIADDFVIPANARWTVTSVGANLDSPFPDFTGVTVTFYADDGTGNSPTVSGNLAGSAADTLGNLAAPVTLDPGHYWVGLTATGTVVAWPTRSVQSNSRAVADSAACTRWSVMQDCDLVTGPGPDMAFSIDGTSTSLSSGGVLGDQQQSPAQPAKKKCKKPKKHARAAKKCKKKKRPAAS